jgi:hypothetical protein
MQAKCIFSCSSQTHNIMSERRIFPDEHSLRATIRGVRGYSVHGVAPRCSLARYLPNTWVRPTEPARETVRPSGVTTGVLTSSAVSPFDLPGSPAVPPVARRLAASLSASSFSFFLIHSKYAAWGHATRGVTVRAPAAKPRMTCLGRATSAAAATVPPPPLAVVPSPNNGHLLELGGRRDGGHHALDHKQDN